MRHGNKVNNLGRKAAHRKAMLSNMACSLIQHKRINTTVAKAKALRGYVEPLLTKSKTDSTHSRRTVFSYLQNKDMVTELFREIAPKIAERQGGYTRIIRTGYRLGDNAEMCMIELVDFNEIYTNDKAKKTTRRSRRGGAKKDSDTAVVEATEVVEVEEAAKETVENVEVTAEVVEEAPVMETEVATEEVTTDDVPSEESSTDDSSESTDEEIK
jgi:large subunit ribosomal protein L17